MKLVAPANHTGGVNSTALPEIVAVPTATPVTESSTQLTPTRPLHGSLVSTGMLTCWPGAVVAESDTAPSTMTVTMAVSVTAGDVMLRKV